MVAHRQPRRLAQTGSRGDSVITFWTIPRAFTGEFDEIQREAIASWRRFPDRQIILMGSEAGAYEYSCETAGVDWIGDLPTNTYGTPRLDIAFSWAEEYACHDLLCEVSADVQLQFAPAALDAITSIDRPFVIGQRWDVDGNGDMKLHAPYGIDYFIYRKGTLGEIPPFAVGRTAYDNWLVWAALERWGLQVIDATEMITAIHPEHGRPHYGTRQEMLRSQERAENLRLFRRDCDRIYGVKDAPFVLTPEGVKERGKV